VDVITKPGNTNILSEKITHGYSSCEGM